MLHATERDQRRRAVGQPAPALLALAGAVRHRWMGRYSRESRADGDLRCRPARSRPSPSQCCSDCIIAVEGPDSKLASAVGSDRKERASLACYIAAIPLAFVNVWIARGLFVVVALLWLVPDRRIERVMIDRDIAPE